MYKRIDLIIDLLKRDLTLFLSICIGIFLFVLFFQPFKIDRFDFNNMLLFIAGLGAIVFIFMIIIRVLFALYFHDKDEKFNSILPSFFEGFLLLAVNSVAYAFYLRFVGSIEISFYIMFKIILICLAPPVVLRLVHDFKGLKFQNEKLIREKRVIQKQIEKFEDDNLNKSVEFVSDNSTDNLILTMADIALIRSADNYVEISFTEADLIKKKLIRNTLKNIELQVKPYSNFIRCHRTSIVNTHYVEKLIKSYNNYWLIIRNLEDKIPVSRQYILKIKEAI